MFVVLHFHCVRFLAVISTSVGDRPARFRVEQAVAIAANVEPDDAVSFEGFIWSDGGHQVLAGLDDLLAPRKTQHRE